MQQVDEQFQQRFNFGRGMLFIVDSNNVVYVRLLHLQNTAGKAQFIAFLQGLTESLQEMYLLRVEDTTFYLSLCADSC